MSSEQHCAFPPVEPNLQISFYYRLQTLRDTYLQAALRRTVAAVDTKHIDKELADYVSPAALKRVASFGLRGEVFFPVPMRH